MSLGEQPVRPAPPLCRATTGSAGVDLCAASPTILNPEDGVQTIPTGVFGPPPLNSYFFIMGCASSTLAGLMIHPSLVDNDYTGEIQLLATTPYGPVSIDKGQHLAQALLIPVDTAYPALVKRHGVSRPRSSDLYWVQAISQERPTLKLTIQGRIFEGILDSGADSTVLSQEAWPTAWPLQASITHLQGIGQSRNTLQSSQWLPWKDNEGNACTVRPFVVPGLPVNLWGRDILSQMGIIMCSPNAIVAQQMLSQGFLPGQGLGKNKQGRLTPVSIASKVGRAGLGFHNHFS
ncbi:endogenous retrovirus group K member 21 Pro protein-like [Petaurus breviceps papuanus]|uniref:endogenous retrovirus group K member 21 Pro protein-like n=1 Tax=Petaurus breviceps papuanus TaxID=3040969 RepID=UPI0036D8BBCD